MKTLISGEEYLRTPYEGPEPDFVEGEIVPRSTPNSLHSEAVDALIEMFIRQSPKTLFRRPELRLKVAAERYRIADLAIYDDRPLGAVPDAKPLAIIEVLSPDDSHAELMRKFADFAALGVPHIWLVDPIAKRLSIYHDESLTATPRLEISEHAVLIRHADIFNR